MRATAFLAFNAPKVLTADNDIRSWDMKCQHSLVAVSHDPRGLSNPTDVLFPTTHGLGDQTMRIGYVLSS
jgi:hypothetical protein